MQPVLRELDDALREEDDGEALSRIFHSVERVWLAQPRNHFSMLVDKKDDRLFHMSRTEQMQSLVDQLHVRLRFAPHDVNCDVEVAALLLAHGADPQRNVYTGELPTIPSVLGHSDPDFLPTYPRGSIIADSPNTQQTIPGYAGLFSLCDPNTAVIERKERCQAMKAWLVRHHAQVLLRQLRAAILLRSTAMWWYGKAMESACAEGGHARASDRAAFEDNLRLGGGGVGAESTLD
eukprot:7388914-Prymnesium_polylepis.1